MIQSVDRALDILDCVARTEDGARLSEVAGALGLNRTTVHNLLRTLRLRGYLEQERGGRYRLGSVLSTLGYRRVGQGIFRRAEVEMQRLHADTAAATVTFSELAGREICCRLRLAPASEGVVQRPQTQTFHAFGSASGLCLQAFNPAYREAMTALHGFEESGQRYWKSPAEFERALLATRQRGVAVMRSDSGVRFAAPVGDGHVLGVSMAGTESGDEALAERVRAAAGAIARA